MVYYYTIKIANPGTMNDEQKNRLDNFVKEYKARVIPGKQIVLDFQCPRKLIPSDVRKHLKGLEVLSISK